MAILFPVIFGFISAIIATSLGYTVDTVGWWVISAPWILLGGLGFAYCTRG